MSPTAESVITLTLPPKGIFIAILNAEAKPHSKAIALSEGEANHLLHAQESFSSWLHKLEPRPGNHLTYRFVGNPSLFAQLSKRMQGAGLVEGKHVPLVREEATSIHFLAAEHRIRVEKEKVEDKLKKLKVMVVDDSATIRKLLEKKINEDPELTCIGTIESPLRAMEAIASLKPDVITLDIHMPEMDGVTLIRHILARYSIPIIVISALSKEDGTFVFDALESGAVDYIQKPSLSEMLGTQSHLCEKIKAARFVNLNRVRPRAGDTQPGPRVSGHGMDFSYLIAIGSSTGGTEALKTILTQLPDEIPPIVIVQHIPPIFSKAFAERMNQLCAFEVKEGADQDELTPNRVFIAPGGKQMRVIKKGDALKLSIDDSEPVNRHKPSVDVLFSSIADLKLAKVCGAILTGMGADGAKGLLRLKTEGAHTIAQDESTSVVFGMPKEAIKLGGAQEVLAISIIAERLVFACQKKGIRNAS